MIISVTVTDSHKYIYIFIYLFFYLNHCSSKFFKKKNKNLSSKQENNLSLSGILFALIFISTNVSFETLKVIDFFYFPLLFCIVASKNLISESVSLFFFLISKYNFKLQFSKLFEQSKKEEKKRGKLTFIVFYPIKIYWVTIFFFFFCKDFFFFSNFSLFSQIILRCTASFMVIYYKHTLYCFISFYLFIFFEYTGKKNDASNSDDEKKKLLNFFFFIWTKTFKSFMKCSFT